MKKFTLALSLFFAPAFALAGNQGSPTYRSLTLQTPLPISSGGVGSANAQGALQNLVGPPPLYATNFGIVPDGKTLTDISTTAGSAVVDSASYTFTSNDIGKVISVYAGASETTTGNTVSGGSRVGAVASTTGIAVYQRVLGNGILPGTYVAGISGTTVILSQNSTVSATGASLTFVGPVSSTITSVSGGNATLAATATSTVSGSTAMFGSDNSTALENLVVHASSQGGGKIVLPVGAMMIANSVLWASNVSMQGQGSGQSILVWSSAAGMGVGRTGLIFTPEGFFSSAYISNVIFQDFQIDMENAFEATPTFFASCVAMSSTVNWTIKDMVLQGSPASCLRNDYPKNNLIVDNYFAHNGRLSNGNGTGGNDIGATLSNTSFVIFSAIISDNFFYDSGVTGVLFQEGGSAGNNISLNSVQVIGNHFFYDSFNPNSLNISAIDLATTSGAVIANNTVSVNQSVPTGSSNIVGIQDGEGDNTGACSIQSTDTIIANNTVSGMGRGIVLANCGGNNITVTGNNVTNTTVSSCYAIIAQATGVGYGGINFSGNTGHNCASAGLLVSSLGQPITDLKINGNKFYNNSSTSTSSFSNAGIAFSGNSNVIGPVSITNNELYDDSGQKQANGIGLDINTTLLNADIENNRIYGNTNAAFFFGSATTSLINGLVINNTTQPVFTVTGATTPIGLDAKGTFVANVTGTSTVTVTPSGTGSNVLAPHGWYCPTAQDITTPADSLKLISTTQSTATFSGATVSGDVIAFSCAPY